MDIMPAELKLRSEAKELCLLKLEAKVKGYQPLNNNYVDDCDERDWAAQFINGYESAMRGEKFIPASTECFSRGYKAYRSIIDE